MDACARIGRAEAPSRGSRRIGVLDAARADGVTSLGTLQDNALSDPPFRPFPPVLVFRRSANHFVHDDRLDSRPVGSECRRWSWFYYFYHV